jgi:hypothetical protein
MKKIKLIPVELVLILFIFVKPVHAESACTGVPTSGNYTITTDDQLGCYLATSGTTAGIDWSNNSDSSTSNTAKLIVPNGKFFTIPSGVSPSQMTTITVGSLEVEAGGTIAIGQSYAQIIIGSPLYMVDTDSDGYPDNLTYYSATASGRRRRSLAISTTADCNIGSNQVGFAHAQCYADADADTWTSGLAANTTCLNTISCDTATKASASSNGASVTTYTAGTLRNSASAQVDCNDNSYNLSNSCCAIATRYQDADGDGEGNLNVTISACTTAGYVDNSTDCGDDPAANGANAHHGQTTCYDVPFTHVNGGNSWDYNCDGTATNTGCTPTLNYGCDLTAATTTIACIGGATNRHCGSVTSAAGYVPATIGCGDPGCNCTSTSTHRTKCACCCSFTSGGSYCDAVSATANQKCI